MPSLIPTSEDTRVYECAILYPYPLSQKEEAELLKEVEEIFAEADAKLIAKDVWGRRGLAYSIGGSAEGSYVITYWEMDPGKLQEVDHALQINRRVLRHLIIKPPKGYQVVKFSDTYQEWQKTRESVEEVRAREREEKLQAQVAEKAKRQAAKATGRRKAEDKPKEAVTEEQISQQLEKLISDDSLDI